MDLYPTVLMEKPLFVPVLSLLGKVRSNSVGYRILPNGCWQWTGRLTPDGYGHSFIDGKLRMAHRVVYERAIGPIPPGLQLDHLCRNRGCVNPYHMQPVTQRENALRGNGFSGVNARKTHCPRGHKFSEENTYRSPKGGRFCRACRRTSNRERYRPYS